MVLGTDSLGSCRSNYHTITATTAPYLGLGNIFHLICHLQQYFGPIALVSVLLKETGVSGVNYRHTLRLHRINHVKGQQLTTLAVIDLISQVDPLDDLQ